MLKCQLCYISASLSHYSCSHSSLCQIHCRNFTQGTHTHTHTHTHTQNVHDFLCCWKKLDRMSLNIKQFGTVWPSETLNCLLGREITCQTDVKSSLLLSVHHSASHRPFCSVFVAALQPEEGPDYVRIKKKKAWPTCFSKSTKPKRAVWKLASIQCQHFCCAVQDTWSSCLLLLRL